jgi:hypothetical protein
LHEMGASVAKNCYGRGRNVQVEEGRTAETRTAEAAGDMRGSDAALFQALLRQAKGADTSEGAEENHDAMVDEAETDGRRGAWDAV